MKKQIYLSTFAIFLAVFMLLWFTMVIMAAPSGSAIRFTHNNKAIREQNLPQLGSNALASGEIFTVTSNSDTSDSNPGDCVCKTAGNVCTLRAAIQEANACSSWQVIKFAHPMTIKPLSQLDTLTDDRTYISAQDQMVPAFGTKRPGVILDGSNSIGTGFVVHSSHNLIRGLTIMRFSHNGIVLESGAQHNTISDNVVSANGWNGIYLHGTNTSYNYFLKNKVGTNPIGEGSSFGGISNWGNGHHGISVWDGKRNRVNNNLVANNGWSGITFDNAVNSTIASNIIGFDFFGKPLGNHAYGIHIGNGTKFLIAVRNTIAYNRRGIYVNHGHNLLIQFNQIFSNTTTTEHGAGIMLADSINISIRYNNILSNTALIGGGIAAEGNTTQASILSNTIRNNIAHNPLPPGNYGGGGIYAYKVNKIDIDFNHIISNSAKGNYGTTPFIYGGAIYLKQINLANINNNEIRRNTVVGHDGQGGAVCIKGGNTIHINRNKFLDNRIDTVDVDSSALYISVTSPILPPVIDANWFFDNKYGFHTIFIHSNRSVNILNNLLTHNHDLHTLYLHVPTNTVKIYNNTIAYNDKSGITVSSGDIALHNNIITSNGKYGIELQTPSATINQKSNNDVWNNSLGPSSNHSLTFFMSKDPEFLDASANQYALRINSPCLDTGDALHMTVFSYNNIRRPQGAGPDIGAYEMVREFIPLIER